MGDMPNFSGMPLIRVESLRSSFNYAQFIQSRFDAPGDVKTDFDRFVFDVYFHGNNYKEIKSLFQTRFSQIIPTDNITNEMRIKINLFDSYNPKKRMKDNPFNNWIDVLVKYFVDPSTTFFDENEKIPDDDLTLIRISRRFKNTIDADFKVFKEGVRWVSELFRISGMYGFTNEIFREFEKNINLESVLQSESMLNLYEKMRKIEQAKKNAEAEEMWYQSNITCEFAEYYLRIGRVADAISVLKEALQMNVRFYNYAPDEQYKRIAESDNKRMMEMLRDLCSTRPDAKKWENKKEDCA